MLHNGTKLSERSLFIQSDITHIAGMITIKKSIKLNAELNHVGTMEFSIKFDAV